MSELKKLKDLGVTGIQVKDGIATAVNPWTMKKNGANYPLENWKLVNNISPLPAPSVPDREYEIDELQEWDAKTLRLMSQVMNIDHKILPLKGNVLILKQPEPQAEKVEIVCYCGSIRVALEAFKKAEYEAVLKGEIALLPCCMFVDIEREHGAESDYKIKADDLHKRKIDISDKVIVLNVGGYIGSSTRSEIDYAIFKGVPVEYLEQI